MKVLQLHVHLLWNPQRRMQVYLMHLLWHQKGSLWNCIHHRTVEVSGKQFLKSTWARIAPFKYSCQASSEDYERIV